jgi:hypothetical protein
MSVETNKIEKLFKEITELKKLVLKNQVELKAIKVHLFEKAKPLPVGAYVHIAPSYEWGSPTIKISPTKWKKIKSGKHLKIRGQGWRFNDYFDEVSDDQFFKWDYWEFNGGIGKPLIVTMRDKQYGDEVVYNGELYSSMIEEFKIKPKEQA